MQTGLPSYHDKGMPSREAIIGMKVIHEIITLKGVSLMSISKIPSIITVLPGLGSLRSHATPPISGLLFDTPSLAPIIAIFSFSPERSNLIHDPQTVTGADCRRKSLGNVARVSQFIGVGQFLNRGEHAAGNLWLSSREEDTPDSHL